MNKGHFRQKMETGIDYGVTGKTQVVWYVWNKWGQEEEEQVMGDGAEETN